MDGVGRDKRIGGAFLNAGIGYGGSCFPKDARALDYLYSVNGHHSQLLRAVIDVNTFQRRLPVAALRNRLVDLHGKKIAVLGLSFKPDTDDTREAPAQDIIGMLLVEGARVDGYDPVGVMDFDSELYRQASSIEEAVAGAEAVVVSTEWDHIVSADWETLCGSMSGPRLVFDGRNCVSADRVRAGGGEYLGIGCR